MNQQPTEAPFTRAEMTDYLSALFDAPVTIHELAPLGTEESENQIKGFGYGQPLLLGIERETGGRNLYFTLWQAISLDMNGRPSAPAISCSISTPSTSCRCLPRAGD